MAQMENEVAGRTAVGVAACAVAAAPASAVTAAVRATSNLVSHVVTFFNGHSFGEWALHAERGSGEACDVEQRLGGGVLP